jgi:nitroreductase
MDTWQTISTRRSIREFTAEPVPVQLVQKMLMAASMAASGGNLQAWSFLVVQDPRRLQMLGSLAPGIIGKPQAVFILCVDISQENPEKDPWLFQYMGMSLGAAMQNLLLTAHDLGLGACPVASFHQKAVQVFLNIPEHMLPLLLVATGFPQYKPQAPAKKEYNQICFTESWGNPL